LILLQRSAKLIPYPINLCHPDSRKSCGACCGLYNWGDHSRTTLKSFLQARTEGSSGLSGREDVAKYRREFADPPGNPKLLEAIYNCEFLGFIDPSRARVGCLLHPSRHGREDLRFHSFYGDLCASHFCPSYTYLTATEQLAVCLSVDDWYLYGLVITDIDLVKEFFRHAHGRLGETIHPARLTDPGVSRTLQEFFRLKESWKFASGKPRLGKYYFSHAEYRVARIEYEKNWGVPPSRFDKILVSLSSEFFSKEDVIEAERMIEEKVAGFVQAYLRAGR
jgi:hypothetical protein